MKEKVKYDINKKLKKISLDKPIFGDKKAWQVYWYLEKLASNRKYREIGFLYVKGYLIAQLDFSERKIRNILKRLSKSPYKLIKLEEGQISVIPMNEVLKLIEESDK